MHRYLSPIAENCYFLYKGQWVLVGKFGPPGTWRVISRLTGCSVFDWLFLLVTGVVAYHALTYHNEDGENDIGHLLFGSIALLFFLRVLFVDILKIF